MFLLAWACLVFAATSTVSDAVWSSNGCIEADEVKHEDFTLDPLSFTWRALLSRVSLSTPQVRGALVGSVFRKMLKMDTSDSTYSSGELTNLMSVDAQSVLEYSCYTHFIWATSLQV